MTARHTTYISISALALTMILTSCSTSESGTPTTSPSDDGTTPTISSEKNSVTIEDPIDTTQLLSEPCTALAKDDLGNLGLNDGRVDDENISQVADACVWERAEDSGSRADLVVVTENANGLEGVRQQNQNSELYEETQIRGYPALHASVFDDRERGRCDLWVGVNDSEVLFIYVSLRDVPEADDPCGYADQVGEAAIANLTS
ncbi:DUF3558 domain-containing protein [Saccharomonospora halophila]|uniref:DUF3558 domain-containing protein n=1 Tax=Saccharomonospora halophila TaxID=129922 RepID=UPI000A07527F